MEKYSATRVRTIPCHCHHLPNQFGCAMTVMCSLLDDTQLCNEVKQSMTSPWIELFLWFSVKLKISTHVHCYSESQNDSSRSRIMLCRSLTYAFITKSIIPFTPVLVWFHVSVSRKRVCWNMWCVQTHTSAGICRRAVTVVQHIVKNRLLKEWWILNIKFQNNRMHFTEHAHLHYVWVSMSNIINLVA